MDINREKELKSFDDTKAGVKGLVDAGVVKLPKIFIRPVDELAEELNYCQINIEVPVIDLDGIRYEDRRKDIVKEICAASETWGFFQVVNHGIPLTVLDDAMNGLRMFHEQDQELKKEFYTRDQTKKVRYSCNHDLYQSRTANWRDSLAISLLARGQIKPEELPAVCRDTALRYIEHVREFGDTLFELLSEALGLKPDYLHRLECAQACLFVNHYYPACPEPELTLGASSHFDPVFLTVLLQDQIGGLQVAHNDQWVNVRPINGALVINIGELLQILSNGKFRSVNHRVVANRVGPRISIAIFFVGSQAIPEKVYGPIEELLSKENPPRYKEFLVSEFVRNFYKKGLGDKSDIDEFKIQTTTM
ncbi:Non-hem dioxygenase N-terminal domain [Dillenia turbinata]|uniref:Non-hem dioxygenase N-terminal domain n=1 Tax=Dillenia turbinata TaxID=194707 RepID=A0AAN8VLY9_9MAGN